VNRHALDVLEFNRIVELVRGKCLSPLGAARTERMVPFVSPETMRDRHARLREVLGIIDRKGTIPLGGAVDLSAPLARATVEGAILEPAELLQVLRMARMADDVKRFFRGEAEPSPKLMAIASGLEPLTAMQKEIARCLDEDGRVVDRASSELAAIRSEIESTREEVRAVLERTLHSRRLQRSLQEPIITLRNGRYVLPVKEEERRAIEGIVHDHSGSGATVFIEPIETVEKNNRLARLHREEEREVRRILRSLTDRVRDEGGALARNGEILALLDFTQAKGMFARETRSVIPECASGGRIRIRKGRHPLLEKSLVAAGRGESLTPLDIEFPEGAATMVLTGPNAGGKTVALKTIGLFALMAQAGLGVPAEEGTELPFFEKIFADIGDEQSIESSLSSFSARLRHMVRILEDAGPGSLVLLDELGSGTDPSEGAALAMSVLEEIHSRGAVSFVTTHLGSLKIFVHEHPGMVNASMAFDRERLWPTYRLEVGFPGTSHALEIAARLGIPEAVVERARGYSSGAEGEIDSLLDDLRARAARAGELERALAGEKERIAALSSRLDEEARVFGEEKRRWESAKTAEAKRVLDDARALVERVVREIRGGGAETDAVRRAHRALEEERERLAARLQDLEAPRRVPEPVEVGQMVHVRSMNRDGQVVALANREGRVLVETGGIRLEIPASDLGPPKGKTRAKPRGAGLENPPKDAAYELDLRGLRIEEARTALDRFLDRAAVSGLPSVRIIHGIGTGKVRAEVGAVLAEDPRVESFRLGENGGFTVVEMG